MTDYAIRCVLVMAQKEGRISSKEISGEVALERGFTQKILRQLRDSGLVTVSMGSTGGYALSRPAEQITLRDVMETMEDTLRINRCLEEDEYCSRNAVATCNMHAFYLVIQEWLDNYFENTTIRDILDGNIKDPYQFARRGANAAAGGEQNTE